ncbi:alpha-L-rhamnosidase [bacterium A37T11]|nr:alpha-L-rhamnosidase [bacterium A37T11]
MKKLAFGVWLLVAFSISGSAQEMVNALKAGFVQPPDSVRPGVYWYFMDGNRSREGMKADLEAMKKAGIGSVIFLEVNVGVPKGPVDFLSEEWDELFVYAMDQAKRLGIDVILGTGPGWAGSGGPWVSGQQSMQHLVASAITVRGGNREVLQLPLPPPKRPYFGESALTPELKERWNTFYQDVAVLAFPTPQGDSLIGGVDEKALYYRAPFSSSPGVKPYLPEEPPRPDFPAGAAIDRAKIIDLSKRLRADGSLAWDVPPGNWTVMRFVSRNNGAVTRPAPMAGVGFEVDKFDTTALNAHLEHYVGTLFKKLPPHATEGTGGLKRLHIDSWEMGAQNWSPHFKEEFKKRRGYDPMPFYPVYAGRVVQSPEWSERFLWDLRLTSQELIVENHAQHVKDWGRRLGLRLSIEPYDMNPAGDLELGAVADVPMCEFWSKGYGFDAAFSCTEATSIAHVQGKPVVAAEAFTAQNDEAWKQYPAVMKDQTDWALASGINQFMFHTFQHQPLADSLKPGMTMGPYGVHWDRNQTWWYLSDAYHLYVSRCSYLLQQGSTVADILYLTPEGAPMVFTPPPSAYSGVPILPDRKGYNFDGCAPSLLMDAQVEGNEIVFPGGARYRLLVLPLIKSMTPELLRKISNLVMDGATVVGIPPLRSPGLSGYPQCDREVLSLSQALWGSKVVPAALTKRKVGKGSIWWGGQASVSEAGLYPGYAVAAQLLKGSGMPVDFLADKEVIRYTHRTMPSGDLYFVSNKTDGLQHITASFRVQGMVPELWNPLTGAIRALPDFIERDRLTQLRLRFEPHESFFVVFRKKGNAPGIQSAATENFPQKKRVATIDGPWEVSFDRAWGGPGRVKFDTLTDWTKRPEDGIRFYSGTAVYTKDFLVQAGEQDGRSVFLDLGELTAMARVTLNGVDVGTLWTAPWRLDISKALRPGSNQLKIEVVNLWVNRLIGDEGLPQDQRYTYTTFNPYKKESPLLPSGLLGPVRILKEE